MSHRKETALDVAEYTFGGPLFFVVAGATAAVMAVGFAVITTIVALVAVFLLTDTLLLGGPPTS